MARYAGAVCRLCRREGMKLFLKGERCYTEKCAIERRLDNVAYRLGFATSRPQARQLVRHGHFAVNGRKVDIPSYLVKAGDVVTVRGGSQKNVTIQHALEEVKGRGVPEWLALEGDQFNGRIVSLPTREQINLPVQEQLIVELYSK